MAGTRSSARNNASSSPPSTNSNGGTKRKADDSSPSSTKSKRGRPSKASKEQLTLEETIAVGNNGDDTIDLKAKDTDANADGAKDEVEHGNEEKTVNDEESINEEKTVDETDGADAFDQVKADEKDVGMTSKNDQTEETDNSNGATTEAKPEAIVDDQKRKEAMPSNIMEKGIIYFFTRGRVMVDNPESVQDLQRSFFVLRPLPNGAKLTDGTIQDIGNNRLCALPKKVFPKSGKDRFMAFIEKAATSMETLKEEFFQGSEYSTATTGTRHTPEVTPLGEGVYAMTSTGGGQGTTHLAYMLTIPKEIGEVQKDVGLAEKGSFVLSVKNPEASAPAGAQLPALAEYPKEFIEEFHGRGWLPAQPKHLDYANASFLLIGENFDTSSNLDPTSKDEKDDSKETPEEELQKLEHEDELRVEHLNGDDTIFADLGISSKDYSMMTTW